MPAPVLKLLSAALAESDADLLGRFVSTRDEPAFAELVRRHGPAVYRVCRRLAGPSSADDAFQATFLVLACRANAVRKAASVGSWLIGVAGRVGRQMHRRAVRVQRTEFRGQAASGHRSPDLCLLTSELSQVLDDELSRLPASLRDPVTLCLIDGRTQEQAAALLGGSVRTVRRRLERAKAVLRARLERRGVVPAVAAGLVAGVGGPSAAVPPDLARRTVAGVHTFLTGGGASTPAAVAAKGVVGGMVKLKVSAALATLAAAVIGLGVGLADEKPRPAGSTLPPTDLPPKTAAGQPPRPPAAAPAGPGVAEHKTANFVVRADHPAVARALANELEVQRREQAREWLGKELPPWPEPCRVTIKAHVSGTRHEGGMELRLPGRPDFRQALLGDMDGLLTEFGPRAVARLLFAAHLGDEPPGWVYGVVYNLMAPAADGYQYARCWDFLATGRALRLKTLIGQPRPKDEWDVYEAQGCAVGKYLLTRGDKPTFVRFVAAGVKDGWDRAVKDVYGFADVDALEAAWLAWMKQNPPPPRDDPRPADPTRIPPVKLADPKPAADEAPGGFRKTDNFTVQAPTVELAYMVGGEAERLRKLLAERWLGKELPAWPQPLPITIKVTPGPARGATTFTFGDKGMTSAEMELHGPVQQVLTGQLPHELMHAVLAHHFGRPVPRWADEGIAVTAEPESEQQNHEVKAREYLNGGRGLRLGVLFRLTEYPRDLAALYAQGCSVVRFLVGRGGGGRDGRAKLLRFVELGMAGSGGLRSHGTAESWDKAAKEVYGFGSVDELEEAWINHLRAADFAPVPLLPRQNPKPGDFIPPPRLPAGGGGKP